MNGLPVILAQAEFVLLGLVVLIVLLPLIWLVGNYNRLVRLRQHLRESWSNVDTELKRRYDLIPNLVEICRGYARHEREVLEQVTRARQQALEAGGLPEAQARLENTLVGAVRQLFAVVEGYPQLKASQNFSALQNELANTEDRIQAARRFYNANVRDINNAVQMFPSSIVASMFGFREAEYFEVEDADIRAAPQVHID